MFENINIHPKVPFDSTLQPVHNSMNSFKNKFNILYF